MSHDTTKSTNQRICQRLVEREVYYCVSALVDYFANNPRALDGSGYCREDDVFAITSRRATVDDCQLVYDGLSHTLIDCDGEEIRIDRETAAKYRANHGGIDGVRFAQMCEDHVFDWVDSREAYEHWIVSDYLAEKLAEQGEITGELFGLTIWGRCTTGQAIALDSVIGEIAADMGILAGQPHAWEGGPL